MSARCSWSNGLVGENVCVMLTEECDGTLKDVGPKQDEVCSSASALSANVPPSDESVQQKERVASIITFPPRFHLYWIVVERF